MPHKPKATTAKAAAKVREQKESKRSRQPLASSLSDGTLSNKQIRPLSLLKEKATLSASAFSGSVFQVQGQYLHCKIISYFDYKSEGKENLVKQIVIDPQDTLPIFGSTGSSVIGAEPVDVKIHVLQPNSVTSATSPGTITTSSSKPLLVASSIPLQYATGTSGAGFRQFGWGKTTTQINPCNDPSWIPVFDFSNTELPRGAVWDMTSVDSNLCCGAFWVLDPDTFAQAVCDVQFRAEIEIRIPLPNINLAKWKVTDNVGSKFLDEIGTGFALGYEPCLTEIINVKKDARGRVANEIVDNMRMAEYRQNQKVLDWEPTWSLA